MNITDLINIPQKRRTKKHRLAISPGILGTVYGVNAEGEARYFDYDVDGALAFAGVTWDGDPRWDLTRVRAAYVKDVDSGANPAPSRKCMGAAMIRALRSDIRWAQDVVRILNIYIKEAAVIELTTEQKNAAEALALEHESVAVLGPHKTLPNYVKVEGRDEGGKRRRGYLIAPGGEVLETIRELNLSMQR